MPASVRGTTASAHKNKSARTGGKTPPKRTLHPGRLAVVILTVVLILCLAVLGVQKIRSSIAGGKREAVVDEKLASIAEAKNKAAAASAPAQITPASFSAFQNMAKAQLTAYEEQIRSLKEDGVSVEEAKSVSEMSSPEDLYVNIFDNIERFPQEYIDFLSEDPRRLNFVSAYVNQEPYVSAPGALSEDLSTLPALTQYDLRWAFLPYAGSVIGLDGSAPAALSAAAAWFTQNPTLTPDVIAGILDEYQAAVGDGTLNSLTFPAAAAEFGVAASLAAVDPSVFGSLISQGSLILGYIPAGTISGLPQYVLISDTPEPDSVMVHFPAFPADDGIMSFEDAASLITEAWALSPGDPAAQSADSSYAADDSAAFQVYVPEDGAINEVEAETMAADDSGDVYTGYTGYSDESEQMESPDSSGQSGED